MKYIVRIVRYECEKCKTLVGQHDSFCKMCGYDLKKEDIFETETNVRVVTTENLFSSKREDE